MEPTTERESVNAEPQVAHADADPLHEIKAAFAKRLLFVFENASDSEIGRRLDTNHATVRVYTRGERLPTSELLLRIGRATGVNLHWLLTGRGPRRVEGDNAFSEAEESEIRQLAERQGKSFDEMVRSLATAALELNRQIGA